MLKVEYRDHIGFENKRLENEIHSRMTAYRAAMGGEELTKAGLSGFYMSIPKKTFISGILRRNFP